MAICLPSGETSPRDQPPPGNSASTRAGAAAIGSISDSVVTISLRLPPAAVRSSGSEVTTTSGRGAFTQPCNA